MLLVANMAGVNLTAWSPQSEIKEEYYARVPMQLELDGRFHQVAKFFYGIGQNDRIMNIENITISDPVVVADESCAGTSDAGPAEKVGGVKASVTENETG